ncbi:AraC family transcriptional regulator ligand-binding domain-containing protein [Pseudovibrio denitrificans]|uniref:AraC family transcriptional regulator n=1 Tax=Pseudovibrio denitrificans TaxID=258256 RepID=UPI0039BF3837
MTQGTVKFAIDDGWKELVKQLGIRPQDLLVHAQLPTDLISRGNASLTAPEYLRLLESLGILLDDPFYPLMLGQSISVEQFSPPIFAGFCSANLIEAIKRISQYKMLIGPVRLTVQEGPFDVRFDVQGPMPGIELPMQVVLMELVFIVHLARLALREQVMPKAAFIKELPEDCEPYEEFLGCKLTKADHDGHVFSEEVASRPFLSTNKSMWAVFEPALQARLNELTEQAGYKDKVRACLTELLASGHCSIEDVARKLAVSQRTLQRKLAAEATSFQEVLNELREELAWHYLGNTDYSSAKISFLIGYNDPNSFVRAFHGWTGRTPEAARRAVH